MKSLMIVKSTSAWARFALGLTVLVLPNAPATAGMTRFQPSRDGFMFENTFQNNVVSQLDIRTGGLCGGMSYAALDYFNNAAIGIPDQDFRPQDNSTLQRYIYGRQVTSLTENADKWSELVVNPFGARSDEFFTWGLQGTGGGRLQELRASIDAGKPIPLGLFTAGNGGMRPHHQVVAIGYDMGAYRGDLGNHKEDLKIFVYDPNFPRRTMTLVPDPARKDYFYREKPSKRWMTYFVDRKYQPVRPPRIANPVFPKDGKVHELILTFTTGGDDLRGGHDNLNVTINCWTGDQQTARNVNLGARWINDYDQTVAIPLTTPVAPDQIKCLDLQTTFRGGLGGDNWNLDTLTVRGLGGNVDRTLVTRNGHPLVRFTGDHQNQTIKINATPPAAEPGTGPLVRSLRFEFRTGSDDLRGGNDNVNLTVRYADGRTQVVNNVNAAQKWGNNSSHTVNVDLLRPVALDQVRGVTLSTTFGGGLGGDNWNLNSLRVTAVGSGIDRQVFFSSRNPLNRFTGSKKTFEVTF